MKIFLSFFLICILVISLSLGLDESAMKLQDEAFNRAITAFGLAKALNAVISLIQGTELSFTPVGVGLNFSVGEILDPFNDMVERFSWVMLFASVSLGVQKLLLLLSSKLFLQVAFALSIALSLGALWLKKLQSPKLFIYSMKIFALLLILRFGAIFFIYSSELLYVSVLQNQYREASQVVEKTKAQLEDLENRNQTALKAQKNESFFDGMSSKYSNAMESLNISKQLRSMGDSIEKASLNIITLITIFVVESILMPLLFLWFILLSAKLIFRVEVKHESIKLLYNRSI